MASLSSTRRISTTCAISVLRNDIKCKYIFMFPKRISTHLSPKANRCASCFRSGSGGSASGCSDTMQNVLRNGEGRVSRTICKGGSWNLKESHVKQADSYIPHQRCWQREENQMWALTVANGVMDLGSTLVQEMAWCLTAPSHYLNQCWLNNEVLEHAYRAASQRKCSGC